MSAKKATDNPSSGLQKGQRVQVPGEVFKTPGEHYLGTIQAAKPGKVRCVQWRAPTLLYKTNAHDNLDMQCFIRFDDETKVYWFPPEDVAPWVEAYTKTHRTPVRKATPQAASASKKRKHSEEKPSSKRPKAESSAKPSSGVAETAQLTAKAGTTAGAGSTAAKEQHAAKKAESTKQEGGSSAVVSRIVPAAAQAADEPMQQGTTERTQGVGNAAAARSTAGVSWDVLRLWASLLYGSMVSVLLNATRKPENGAQP